MLERYPLKHVRAFWNESFVEQGLDGGKWVAEEVVAWLLARPGPMPEPDADLNGDDRVTAADLGILLASWGDCAGCAADFNGDGLVAGFDVGVLLGQWTP